MIRMSRSKKNKIRGVILALFCIFMLGLTVIFISDRLIYHYYTNNTEKAVSRAYMRCFTRVEIEENIENTEEVIEEYVGEDIGQDNQLVLDNVREDNEYSYETINYSSTYETRMTSYWANDGYGTGDCTGSGLCSWDFRVNEHGWYTYNGKLVVATATTYLTKYGWSLAKGVRTYNYYDEITLVIDGVDYPAIVLDSCGSSMSNGRIDLFVSGGWAVKDTTILVKE